MSDLRKGFSLIEVMVAMTLLSIVLMSLAKIGVTVATRGRINDMTAKRNAALQLETNKLGATPFDSLKNFSASTKTFTRGDFTYTRNITLSAVTTTRYMVKITVTPASNAARKDSVIFERTKPATGTPLCVGC